MLHCADCGEEMVPISTLRLRHPIPAPSQYDPPFTLPCFHLHVAPPDVVAEVQQLLSQIRATLAYTVLDDDQRQALAADLEHLTDEVMGVVLLDDEGEDHGTAREEKSA